MRSPLGNKPRRSDAYIVEVDGRFLVRPSPAILRNKNKFLLSNLTPFPAEVALEPTLDLEAGETNPLTIDPGGFWEWRLKDLPEGAYRYKVTLDLGNNVKVVAHGDSDPVIIIDPAP
jgi:hypothetical protein